ncbi:MAG: 8-amino-7-oxononanoate synthase [Mediterranea sp.]|jgi:8-amino-7-oxononanoate synthase|nr:8-amino-7-oxononanoate synthase [Mediterranea sp.]
MSLIDDMQQELQNLRAQSNLRTLPRQQHQGKYIVVEGRQMLNLSSNDYLGLAADDTLRQKFCESDAVRHLFTSSSSRLLTGNFAEYEALEQWLAERFHAEAALLFNSGYHANTGILPAVTDAHTLILADKLVHASLIDGIRLSAARCIRYRHNDMSQLERLLNEHHTTYRQIVVVTESIFSMDGDEADLPKLVELKRRYENVLLYVDEAHAFGVRGATGLGCAEEQQCTGDIDFLVGTFGKAAASMGAYLVCNQTVRNYLINKMRTLIFSTALPPINVAWTQFVLAGDSVDYARRREHLQTISHKLRAGLQAKGYTSPGNSHIVPLVTGSSAEAVEKASMLQSCGFYALPVRPPTVPEGGSRIRFSLTAALAEDEIERLLACL